MITKTNLVVVIELIVLTIIASFLFFVFFRSNTPIHYIANWDLLHHVSLIRQLIQGNFSFILSQISDTFTFNSYTPLFHYLMAIPTLLFKTDILYVMWWGEFGHYLFTTFVSYWIGKKILKNQWGGLITALVSLVIFESTVAYTTLFLLPLTVAGTLGALFIVEIITTPKGHPVAKKMIVSSLIIFLMHYLIGAVYIFLMLIESIYRRITRSHLKKIFIAVSFGFLLLSLLMEFLDIRLFITTRPDAKHFIYSLKELFTMLYQWYGFLPALFIPYGIYTLIKSREDAKSKIVFISFFLTALAFFPFSYSLKIYVLARYFVNLLIAAGILGIINQLKSKSLQVVLAFFILLALCSIFC